MGRLWLRSEMVSRPRMQDVARAKLVEARGEAIAGLAESQARTASRAQSTHELRIPAHSPSLPLAPPTLPLSRTMDDFFNPPASEAEPSVEDFLAREAAALGPDAHSFSTPGAQQDKDFEASASAFPDLDGGDDFATAPVSATSHFTGNGGAFGEQERGQVSVTNDNEFSAFENEYPAVDVEAQQEQPQVS